MLKSVFRSLLILCGFILVGCATTQDPASSGDCRRVVEENHQLRDTLTRAQRALETSQAAYQEMDNALKTSARQIVLLREELMLYRNIVAPPDGKSGLRIQQLNIQPTGISNIYRYRLTLVQSMKHATTIQGRVSFQVVGLQNGRDVIVRFPAENEQPRRIRLKYFQEISGTYTLPRGFKPRTIRVSVMTSGRPEIVARTFTWPVT